ncbi:hypothetical protein CPB84DRAFT_1832684 [Gymnopilus junonius]|uniref:Dicer-like protein 1 n=1 Tax=Gymnopilus junonius TaxID=109634 RepID=A0A9P5NZB0_GYMJU|nr:hypothetical protein CPB84DRAFT_1832684 [Gymnopilus junonius]
MLKYQRKIWKDQDKGSQSPASTPGPDIDPTQASSGDSAILTDPHVSLRNTSPSISISKRTRDSFEPDNKDPALSERPAKFLKTSNIDSLRNHLPEIIDPREREEARLGLSMLSLKEQILEQAKYENIIATLPATKSSLSLSVDLVSWAIEQEQERMKKLPESMRTRNRAVLIVVDEPSTMDIYASAFETGIQDASIGRYTEEIHHPELETWSELLKKDIVMTPAHLLLDSLIRGALAVTQLQLLVITDAQNIRNQDSHASMPIVQIMNDFYRITDSLSRPRIFAVVSIPNDRQSYFDSKMLKLEQTLCAKVFGVTEDKRAEILALPDRPNEIVILYDTVRKATETRLLKQLHQIDPTESIFRRYYRDARHAHEEIGSCASDLIWRRALKDIESGLISGYDDLDEDDVDIPIRERMKVGVFRVVKNWMFAMPNLDASSRGFNVSHKFLRLTQILTTFKTHGEGFRGIIFVQRRPIALVLADLLRMLDDRFFRPQAVVGSRRRTDSFSYEEVFNNFASGVFNLLIATKSIEDLDVPKASVVIRYDLFESQISHAYVRARTRGRESHLVHMVERGNDVHRRILSRITNIDADMLRWTETLCNSPESSIPPTSLRETINPYHSDSDDEDEEVNQKFLKDPTTNGRIYLEDATTVIYRYTAALRSKVQGPPPNQGIFIFKDIHKEFRIPRAHICTINCPGTPIDKVTGDPSSSKAQARRSACFNACEKLYNSGLLDCGLFPLPYNLRAQYDYESRKAFEKDVVPEVKTAGTRSYARKSPTFWSNASQGSSSVLYPTIIYISAADDASELFGPVVILTKQPLPDLNPFHLFSSGITVPIRFQRARPMQFNETRLKDAHSFTVRVSRRHDLLLPPLPLDWRPAGDSELDIPDITDIVPWELVSLAGQHWAGPIKHETSEEVEAHLHDAIIQDRWIEFTRRYKVVKVRKDLTPLSKPSDSSRETSFANLFEFCKSKRKGLENLSNFEQPIIQVTKVHAILNHLNPTSRPSSSSSKSPAKYLIPELCAKFTLPASTLSTAMLLPSIMRRIDDFLLVKELDAKFFDHAIREDLLHIAICTPSAGMEYDYERLELLGDAFLKYLSSVYVFVTNPSLNEGSLHVVRQKIISNKMLLLHATRPPNFRLFVPSKAAKGTETITFEEPTAGDKKQVENMETSPDNDQEVSGGDAAQSENVIEAMDECLAQDPEEIVNLEIQVPGPVEPDVDAPSRPASLTAEGNDENKPGPAVQTQAAHSKKKAKAKKKKNADDQSIQWLGDKAIADVAEAIIGAAYISGGRETALQTTKALTIPLSNIDRWSDFGRKVLTPPPNISAKLSPGAIAAIEKIIGHKFNRPHLLSQAMTHSSIQGYDSTSYERLEFLGDAILDFMVIRHIFDRDQQLSPGALTMLKGAMVSNSALAAVCVWSGLQEHLLFESPQLASNIQAYTDELKQRQQREYSLADEEGRSPGQYWLDIEPPKALSDVIESVIGAIYISDNFSPIGAESLFDNILKPFYDKHITLQTLAHHPTKLLFELLQAQGCQQFGITKEKSENLICCYVLVHDIILASADDVTPTSAARQASLLALDAIEGDPNFMTRTCDCRTHLTYKKLKKKSAFEEALERALAGTLDDDENEFGNPFETQVMEEPIEEDESAMTFETQEVDASQSLNV